MRYSLANYILTIEPNDVTLKAMFGSITVGGEGSYLDSVSISRSATMFTTTGYATGGWTHSKNLDKTGTCSITLDQKSDKVSKLIKICKVFESGDYDGFTLTLTTNTGDIVSTCIDSYPTRIPDQLFGESSQTQNWSFTCGQVLFN